MGLFDGLFGPKTIDQNTLRHILTLTKAGMAFLSGSDGGHIVLSARTNRIDFVLNCRSVFYHYQDELGISEESLLKTQGGHCPADVWAYFKDYVNISSTHTGSINGEEVRMQSRMDLAERNTSIYFAPLVEQLSAVYPNIAIRNDGKTLSIVVTESTASNYTYR